MLPVTSATNTAATSASSSMSSSISNYGGLAVAAGSAIFGIIQAQKTQKEQLALQEKIARLSLEQQKELEIRLQNVQGEVAKMQIVYQALALDKNRLALSALNKQKFLGIAVLGAGIIALSVVIYMVKKKQNG